MTETSKNLKLDFDESADEFDPASGLDAPQVDPSSGAHRRQSSVSGGLHRDADGVLKNRPEKRKRSRVTPEQLVELEKEFAINRTPTGAQRKAISDRLGMQERQTQIWFQNRRAKAKHQEQRPPSPNLNPLDAAGLPSSAQLESYIAQLIREKEPVTLIPCSDLKIGHWTRINPSTLHYEVLAYTSQARQCISWFIRSSGLAFKIEVPFSIIRSATLVDVRAPTLVTLVLELNAVPRFFVQQPDLRMRPGETMDDVRKRIGIAPHLPLPQISATPGEWVASNDWTQNQQATRVLRHELTGPRTSILPGVRGFPAAFGLFQEDQQLYHVASQDDGSSAYGSDLFERRSTSPGAFWNDPHTLAAMRTPSSYSGYDSSLTDASSQYSLGSLVSVANSGHTPVSSTHGTPAFHDFEALDLNDEMPINPIAQPMPIHANPHLPLLENQRAPTNQLSGTADLSEFPGFDFGGGDPTSTGLLPQSGLDPASFGLSHPQSQGQLFPGFHDTTGTGTGVSISGYAQQRESERRISDAAVLGNPQASFDFGLGTGVSNYGTYSANGFNAAGGAGAVDIPFEVDATYSSLMAASSVSAYPQTQGAQGAAGFGDPSLYLSGASTGPSQGFAPEAFSQYTQPQPQLLQQTPAGASLVPNGSQPSSRRNSGYYQ